MKYIINGGNKLEGEVTISGNKNAIFPCVAAALLTDEEVILENIPDIKDTESLIEILISLGIKVEKTSSILKIQATKINQISLPKDLMGKLRGSIVLVGAILTRMGKVHFYHPGGDIIGKRSIETHLAGFKRLGAILKKKESEFRLNYQGINKDCTLFLPEASVTACENLILVSVLGKKVVILKNCPKEPHIQDLCKMLIAMGAKIEGVGTDTVKVTGVSKLAGTKFRIGIDYVEVGTYAVAAAITSGKITIKGIDATDLDPVVEPLKRFGLKVVTDEKSITVSCDKLTSIPKLTTNLWPGFPTDLMSVAIVLATQSAGVSLCHDWMYEGRMFFVDKLISMGAQVSLADPHRVFVYGPTRLKGRDLSSPDIRAGMALVLAALVAKGKSVINQAELIERGYEKVSEKLKKLGAEIERVK